jgi:hypothetical protein
LGVCETALAPISETEKNKGEVIEQIVARKEKRIVK